ncbi:unnamed protein product [Linum tenue]|uniref:Uncharacterized protein n=1 Tax=Linum tenue TaxID=586396 RepID=A0AAV0JBC1_9ROSI|nr:unnamed protein product [Linum tenue]
MNDEAPSWADQWGTGGIGAMDDHRNTAADQDAAGSKSGSKNGGGLFSKIKTSGIKWFKPKSSKKTSTNTTSTTTSASA